MGRPGRLAVLAVAVVVAFPLTTQAAFSTDPSHLNRAIQESGQADRNFANRLKIKQAELQPLFVMIPGILGSKLRKGSDLLWGDLKSVKRDDLELKDSEPNGVVPEFMDAFSIRNLFNKDVYGTLKEDLRFTSVNGVRWWDEFPYDWRADILASAKGLHQHLLENRAAMTNREVISSLTRWAGSCFVPGTTSSIGMPSIRRNTLSCASRGSSFSAYRNTAAPPRCCV